MNHSNDNWLIVTILSHGSQYDLAATDINYPRYEIPLCFADHMCPTLKGKPKVYIIHSCRKVSSRVSKITTLPDIADVLWFEAASACKLNNLM